MARIKPDWSNIDRLTVEPTKGELFLLKQLDECLDDSYEVFFNPFLDGDRPDIVIVKKGHGAVIIEVKDWSLSHYTITEDNRWSVQNSIIRSPQAQVFRYKQNMFELHLPILGIRELTNKNFYNVISTYVYFHETTKSELKQIYSAPERQVTEELNKLNCARKNNTIEHDRYDKRQQYLSNKQLQLRRDCRISFAKDTIAELTNRIKLLRKNVLFTEDIYQDFIRRLSPPIHVLEQGLPITFDKKQQSLTESSPERRKIKGVAGCGKTTILAQRAINAHERHGGPVLILTYNITLRHYIRDKIAQIQCKGADNYFEVMHYHGFINNKINEFGIDIGSLMSKYRGTEKEKLTKLYKEQRLFSDITIKEKFETIFIDEVQDYEPEWVKIIRDNFLQKEGEMILFGDQSQNIYERDDNQRESTLVQGFGRWNKLTKSYRSSSDTPLVQLFKNFQESFLVNKYADSEVFESSYVQGSINFNLLAYEIYGNEVNVISILDAINYYVKEYKINPNDMTIICSQVEPLISLDAKIRLNEKTKIMFEDEDDLKQIQHLTGREYFKKVEKIRRRKKCFFMQNSGVIKLSTTHSYKGLESDTVFCILVEGDHEEMVYTGLTRAKTNLVIFDSDNSKYRDFFKENIR